MAQSRSFAELLTEYMERTGIGDAELARRINVNRLTLIRWREGVTERPRHREDVARCADVLRLTPEERDEFLLAAGFQTEDDAPVSDADVDAPAPPEPQSSDRRRRPPIPAMAIGIVAAIGLVLAVVAAAVINAVSGPADVPTPTPVPPTPTAVATNTPAPTSTATPVIPTATPLPATVAREGESLILLAPFANYTAGGQGYNVSGRLQERIDTELRHSGLANARTFLWPEIIRSESEARDVTERSGALLTIWGEYDSGRVLARFTTAQMSDGTAGQPVVNIASSPSELPTTINVSLTGAVRHVALVTSGRVYLDQGEHDRAKAVLGRAHDPPPAEPDALADVRYLLGLAYLEGERFDYDESIAMFSLVLEEEPRSVKALNGRAVAYMQRGGDGDIQKAFVDLTRAEFILPDHAETHSNIGIASMMDTERQDADRAVIAFGKAIELAPEDAVSYVNRAGAYIARGQSTDLGDAWNDLNHALELEPNLAEAYVVRGLHYVSTLGAGDLGNAVTEYTQAIDLAADSPDAWFHRGLVHAELGSLAESAADLEKAANLAPQVLQYRDSACRALVVAGDSATALRYCHAAVQGGYAMALYSRALANAMLGLPDDAERDLADYITWAQSLWGQACRAAYLEAAVLLEAPIATSRGKAVIWDLLEFTPRPVIPGRPNC